MAKSTKRSPRQVATQKAKQNRFLAAYRQCGNITRAAENSAVGARSHYNWLEEEKYAAQFAEAQEEAVDRLIAEVRRRGAEGIRRKKFHKGQPVIDPETGEHYVELEYSDTLLIFLLKALRPEVFRERHDVRHEGQIDAGVHIYLPSNGREQEAIE